MATRQNQVKSHRQIKKIQKRKKPMDFIMLVTVLLLLALGIVMVLSASSPTALAEDGNSYSYVSKQVGFAAIGIVAMLIISKIDYKIYRKYYKIIYVIAIGLLLLVPLIGYEVGGAKRWINIGGLFSLQPSEIVKIGIIVFYAAYLAKRKDDIKKLKEGFIQPLILLVPVIVILIIFQTHLSATIVITFVVLVMMLVAGTRLKYFLTIGTSLAALGAGILFLLAKFAKIGTFRLTRLVSFMDPWADPTGDGWQAIQNLYAIGSGGLFGVGLGDSKQKYLYISEPHNDCIFAVLAEELGFIGCAIVIILFGIFIWRGILAAIKAPDLFGTLLATGITALVAIQVIINIGVVTAVLPVTGMPLPFFSYGGTSLLILLCSVGVLLNISRQSQKV